MAYSPEDRPALANLITIYSLCMESPFQGGRVLRGKGYAEFKKGLAEVVVETLAPIQRRRDELLRTGEYREILISGARRAHEVSSEVVKRAKEKMGLSLFIDPVETKL